MLAQLNGMELMLIIQYGLNFKDAGIIDPTKVTRSALQNAASVAGSILLTECTITDDKDSDEFKESGHNAGNVPAVNQGF